MDGSTDAVNGEVANEVPRASIKGGMSSRLGVIRMGVRGPLCQTSEKGVEGLATVWYPKFVKWSPTRKEK